MDFADISLFSSLMQQGTGKAGSCYVVNSDASKLMLEYDRTYQSLALCKAYLKDMQKKDEKDEYVPASMFSDMLQNKENYRNALYDVEARLVTQITNTPMDYGDRLVFTRLNSDVRDALRDILDDEVIQRAMEMQTEALEEVEDSDEEPTAPTESDETVKETTADDDLIEEEPTEAKQSKEDDYGLDVSSSEG